MMAIPFLVAGDPDQLTGGYIYDARIAAALRRAGLAVDVIGLAGVFPDADRVAAAALDTALSEYRDNAALVIIDGLVFGALPDVVAAHALRLRLVALVHHPLADEAGLDDRTARRLFDNEKQALGHARHVIVTSAFTARRLTTAYDVSSARVDIVEPGLEHAAPVPRALPAVPQLLCVASLIPRKGHAILVDALSTLTDLAWDCLCIGDTERDPGCSAAVRDAIDRRGLASRVHLVGGRPPAALADAYAGADLFVLPSFYEGYGMVVTEALAHGLPVITTTGGALPDTLPAGAGLAVPPGDTKALADALRDVLGHPDTHRSLAAGARRAAGAIPDWDTAGARFAAVLDRVSNR